MNTYQSVGAGASAPAPIRPKLIEAQPLIDDPEFESIIDAADMVGSLARSIAEAAFRADITQLRIHRAEFRQRASELMAVIKHVAPIDMGVA